MRPIRTLGSWGTGCQLIGDFGNGGTSAAQTTQTVSGNGRGVSGKKNQYTESGAISAGQDYLESGSVNNRGQKNKSSVTIGNGSAYTVNQYYTAPANPAGLTSAPQPIANAAAGGSQDTNTIVPTPAAPVISAPDAPAISSPIGGSPTAATSSSSLWQKIQDYWSNFSTWQKIGGATVLVLLLWLIFHRRFGKAK